MKTKLTAFLLLFIALNLLLATKLFAATYYFSSSMGNDAYSSTQAKNLATPWQSINKLNSVMSTLLPGDSVLFKCGDTFYGSININISGSVNSQITFSSYGAGAKPIITGLTMLNSWSAAGTNLWEAACVNCGTEVNLLIQNDSIKPMGRYPNYNTANKGYLNFESHIGNTQITDNQLSNIPNWTGAELVIRKNHWIIDREKITLHTNNTLKYDSTTGYRPVDGYGYFIQNHPLTLDQHGEWYYNPSTKKVLVYSVTTPPTNSIAVSTKDSLMLIKNANNIVLKNLFIKGSNKLSIALQDCNMITMLDCDIKFSGIDGFWASNYFNSNIENNKINYTNNNAYKSVWGQNNTIKNNTIKNTATLPGIGRNGDVNYFAMYDDGNNNIISLNTIDSSAYVGIAFGGNGTLVKNNFITNFDLVKADGGGIYTYKGCAGTIANSKRKIIDNIVLNGKSTSEGTDKPYDLSGEGIYLDDNTDSVDVIGNTVANCGNAGIFLHNAHEIKVKNNTVYNCSNTQLYCSEQGATNCTPNLFIRNNVFQNNILFSTVDTQKVSNLLSVGNNINLFGIFDSNYYCRPLNKETIIYANYASKNLLQWQTEFSKDTYTTSIPVQYQPYKINSIIGANKFSNGTFNSNINGITSCYVSTYNCNTAWDNAGVLDGGAAKLSFSNFINPANTSLTYFNIGSVVANNYYRLKFTCKGLKNNISSPIYLQQSLTPWAQLTSIEHYKINTSRTENEFLFKANATETNASIIIQLKEKDSAVWVDNLELQEVDATIFNPDDYVKFEYNATSLPKVISLSSEYTDVKNNYYNNSVTLQPFTSIILLKIPNVVGNGTFMTAKNGDWNNPTTWIGGVVPTIAADCIVKHNVIVTSKASCKSLKVEQATASVMVNTGVTFTVLQ